MKTKKPKAPKAVKPKAPSRPKTPNPKLGSKNPAARKGALGATSGY
jgi:hypothetical protein